MGDGPDADNHERGTAQYRAWRAPARARAIARHARGGSTGRIGSSLQMGSASYADCCLLVAGFDALNAGGRVKT